MQTINIKVNAKLTSAMRSKSKKKQKIKICHIHNIYINETYLCCAESVCLF